MNPRGTYTAMAVYALNGLLGSIDVEGGVWQASSVLTGRSRSTDEYVDAVAKGRSKGKKLDGRGEKDMPAMMNARPGSGVVTNNIANSMLKDPGRGARCCIASWTNFNFSCTGAAALGQGDGRGAVLRAHGHQPVGDDAVRRHRAAVDVQLGRGLVDHHEHGQRLRLHLDPAGRGAAAVGRQAGGDRGRLAAGRRSSRRRASRTWSTTTRSEFKDPETGKLPANEREFNEIAAKISSAPIWMPKEPLKGGPQIKGWAEFRRRALQQPALRAEARLGRQVRHRDEEVRVLQRDGEEGPRGARQEVQHHGRRHPDGDRLRRARRASPSCRTTSRRSATAASPSTRSPSSTTRSRLNREGRSAESDVVPGVQEGRSGRRVVGRRAEDEPGRRREARPENRRHGQGHLAIRLDTSSS